MVYNNVLSVIWHQPSIFLAFLCTCADKGRMTWQYGALLAIEEHAGRGDFPYW